MSLVRQADIEIRKERKARPMVDKSDRGRKTFLRSLDVERAVKGLISGAARARVAVAYWGVGSSDRFNIESVAGNDILIVCDLMSGACNPREIERLQKALGKSRMLTRDQLHAKVWLTDRGAIVGSSNASANGLGFEGDELKGSIEANVFVNDPETLAAISHWFENDVVQEAREITTEDLREAHARWKRHRITRPERPLTGSLLDAIRTHSASLVDKNLFIWVYEHADFDRWADRALKSEQKARHSSSIDGWQNVEGPIPPAGAYVLDFDIGPNGKAKLDGLYQVLHDNPLVKEKKNTLLLCMRARAFETYRRGNRKSWEDAATAAVRSSPGRDTWRIEDFARFCAV
jgi:hypothetical protein